MNIFSTFKRLLVVLAMALATTTVMGQKVTYVCEIVETGVKYQTLNAALEVAYGKTIRLLDNISQDLEIYDTRTAFDTNGYVLNVGECIFADETQIKLQGAGELNVTPNGLYVRNNSQATVSNVSGRIGVNAEKQSEVIVTGNVRTTLTAVYATGASVVSIDGNVATTGSGSIGAHAEDGSTITIDGTIEVPKGATYIRV